MVGSWIFFFIFAYKITGLLFSNFAQVCTVILLETVTETVSTSHNGIVLSKSDSNSIFSQMFKLNYVLFVLQFLFEFNFDNYLNKFTF